MFTDIVGYTALMEQNEATAAEIRDRHHQVFDREHERHNGKILQYFGDGTLSVFQSGVEAVECAVAIQKALNSGEPVPLRIGLHLGGIVFDGTDIYGDGVNLASRIESMGVAGAILLSGNLNNELKNHHQISTVSLGHFEIEDHLVDAPDIPAETYKRYLKSRYHLLKMSKPDIDMGLSLLEEIIREQPKFTLAYLAVHLGYALLGTIGLMPAGEAFAKGKPFLDKAIELNPDLPECQLHLAWIRFLQEWDLAGAYRHLNKALEIRPVVDFYQSMASTLVAEGKFSAALHYLETALELDPFSEINYHLQGFIFYAQEKFDKAIGSFEKSVQLKSNFSIKGECGHSIDLMLPAG